MLYLILALTMSTATLDTENFTNVVTREELPIHAEIGDILVYAEHGLELAFLLIDGEYTASFTDTSVEWDWEPLVIKASRLIDLPIDSELTYR